MLIFLGVPVNSTLPRPSYVVVMGLDFSSLFLALFKNLPTETHAKLNAYCSGLSSSVIFAMWVLGESPALTIIILSIHGFFWPIKIIGFREYLKTENVARVVPDLSAV